MYGPLLFAGAVGLFVLIAFGATWRFAGQRDPVDRRLQQFGVSDRDLAGSDVGSSSSRRLTWSGTNRMLAASGVAPRLANALAQADMPLTAAEFALIVLTCLLAGLIFGTLRFGLGVGIAIGMFLAYLPIQYLRMRRTRRQRAFSEQIPEILSLLIGALRAGYGLSQSINVIAKQLALPASDEFGRVIRAVSLGLPVERALADMATRMGTDEAGMIVTAINVQHETGGNLVQTLETISDTIRDRLRIRREIRVMTSQQRITGYILAGLPLALVAMLMVINPTYMRQLFQPGTVRLVLGAAVLLQIAGFLVIRKIVDIEV